MNQHLEAILKLIRQSKRLSADEKKLSRQAVKKANKELEAKDKELEIETALERVRAVAMNMKEPADMIEICRTISRQLQRLKIENIRNVQTAIINDEKGTYLNYEYFTPYKTTSVLEIVTKLHPRVQEFVHTIKKSADAFFTTSFKGRELQKWREYRKQTGQNADPILDKAKSLHYYFYSIGPGALGISTYVPLEEEEIKIFHRFRNVFDLAYKRFTDIETAIAQAREAQIEASLERVRSKAMAMHNSSDLSEAAGTVFTELNNLGINPIRTGFVLLTKDSRKAKLYPATSFDKTNTISFTGEFEFTGHPVFEKQYESWQKKENYFPFLDGEVLKSYYKILSEGLSVPYQNFPTDKKQFGSFLPFTEGFLFTWSEEPYSGKEINILNRFKNILDLTIRRYHDLKNAEAQAREAKIEASLERVRSKAMAMHKSDDLNDAVAIVFEELDKLNLGMLRCGIGILHKEKRCADVWTTTIAEEGHLAQVMGDESVDIHPLLQGAFDGWERQKDFSYVLEGEDLNRYYNAVSKVNFKLPDSQSITTIVEGLKQYYYVTAFQAGNLYAFRETPFSDEAKTVMKRFAGVFNLTYQRFLDIQKAEAQAREAEVQKKLIEDKHREITDNISYALRIQTAILPSQKLIRELLPDSFVLYLPKDVVAGDFYWIAKMDNAILFSANDCTGHGVSGAMVSVMCHNALNRAVSEFNLTQPSLILDKVAELIEENFTQSEDKIQDGMDTSLCALHLPPPLERGKGVRLQWAGANNPLWIIRKNEIIEYKPDKQPIGKYENRYPFTNHEIELQQGDNIYLFSDGYHDQFGGERGKKLSKNKLKNIFLSICNKNMDDQHHELLNQHYQWKGREEQVDDICVIGVRVVD